MTAKEKLALAYLGILGKIANEVEVHTTSVTRVVKKREWGNQEIEASAKKFLLKKKEAIDFALQKLNQPTSDTAQAA